MDLSTDLLSGLYAITDSRLTPPEQIKAQVQAALEAGVKIIQYREKQLPFTTQEKIARQLKQLTATYNALLIINDNVDLCLAVDADGVHLGQEDLTIEQAREKLGSHCLIGATCHGSVDLAAQAQSAGADYLAFGRFYPSSTKPDAKPAELAVISAYIQHCPLPCVAIGGITLNNAAPLIEAGFDMVAVVHDIFSQDNILDHCQRYQTLFSRLKRRQFQP